MITAIKTINEEANAMTDHEISQIVSRALHHYGTPAQMAKAEEECAELIVALKHYKLGKVAAQDVITELADVMIMVWQMAEVFDSEALVDELKRKLVRLRDRMDLEDKIENEND